MRRTRRTRRTRSRSARKKKEGQEDQMDTSNNDEPKDIVDKPVAQKEDDILLEDQLEV